MRYGFDDYVSHFNDKKGFSFMKLFISKKRIKESAQLSKWEKMRKVCEELGPTFIKFGQLLSSRRDLMPPELIQELIKLQDNVPAFPGKDARKILEREFGEFSRSEIVEFEEQPFASASMAQVHKGKLATGEKVVFKVQRPNIRKTIEQDIQIMKELAKVLSERMPSIRHFDPVGLVNEFAESIHYELDFIHESINLKRINYNFREQKEICFPTVYDRLTSSRVLTLEFVDGFKPSREDRFDMYQLDKKEIARKIVDSFFVQVFEHGFFHADPHPGNIIVCPDGRIYFIDFGMMGTILKKDMEHLGNLVLAIQTQNVKTMMNAISYLTGVVVFENRKRLEYDLIEYINAYAFTQDFHLQISKMLTDLTDIMSNHNLHVPAHFFLLTRAMFSIEGLVRDMNPEISLMAEIKPIIEKRIIEDRNPISTGEKILNSMYDLGNYMEEFPSDLRQMMKLIRKGKLKVSMQHQGMDPFVHSLNKVGKQIVAVVLVAALLLCSTVFIIAGTKPHWYGVPVYSYIGATLSLIIGLYLWTKIYREDEEFKSNEREKHS